MRGFSAEKWRAWHRKRGERYRWIKAMPCGCEDVRTCAVCDRGGRVYLEQTLPEAARALVHRSQHAVEDEKYGLIPAGSTEISVMPDEAYPDRLDRIILLDRRIVAREKPRRGQEAADVFIRTPVATVGEVRRAGVVYRPTIDYSVTATGIEWHDIHRPLPGATYLYGPTAPLVRGEGDADVLPELPFGVTHVYLGLHLYLQGVDYEIGDGLITWLGEAEPSEGATYTLAGFSSLLRASTPGADTDTPQPPAVIDDATVLRDADIIYRRSVDWEERDGSVFWFPPHPAAGESYAVEYRYHPTYEFLRTEAQVPRPDKTGTAMPLRGLLVEQLPLEAGEE